MANDLNVIALIGRLTRDIDVKYTNGGTAIGTIAIAVNRSVKKQDKWEEEVNFFEVTIFGKSCENLQQYLVKGKQISVVGSLRQDRWTDNEGKNKSKITIVGDEIRLLGGGDNSNGGNRNSGGQSSGNRIAPNTNNGGFSDDVPFEEPEF